MTAENVYQIAIHLPEKELEKLYGLLSEKVNCKKRISKDKLPIINDSDAIEYLLKNIFRKKCPYTAK